MKEYSFKDILVNFRREYLRINEKIKDLESEINILDSSISNIVITLNNDTKALSCYIIEKEKHIISSIINISKSIGLPIFDFYDISLDPSVKNMYHFKNDIKHFHLLVENIKAFTSKLLMILNDNFLKVVNNKDINSIDNKHILNFNYETLSQEANNISSLSTITYYPYKDLIKIEHSNVLNKELLDENLNIKYNSDLFTNDQKNIIETYSKDIELFDENTNDQLFNIIEEDKKLILKR